MHIMAAFKGNGLQIWIQWIWKMVVSILLPIMQALKMDFICETPLEIMQSMKKTWAS